MISAFSISNSEAAFACSARTDWNRPHPLKNLPHDLVDHAVQNMGGIAGLPIALRLLAGLAVADVTDTLYDAVWVSRAGIGFSIGREGQPRSTVAAKDVAGQEGLPPDITGNRALLLCGVGTGGTDALGGVKHLLGDQLQVREYLGTAFPAPQNAGVGQVADDTPDGGVMPVLPRSGPVA